MTIVITSHNLHVSYVAELGFGDVTSRSVVICTNDCTMEFQNPKHMF